MSFAEEINNAVEQVPIEAQLEDSDVVKKPPQQFLIDILRNRLSMSMSLYKNLQDQEDETKRELVTLNEKIGTLAGQLEYIDEQIVFTEKKIRQVRIKIGYTEMEIVDLIQRIEQNEIIFEEQKQVLSSYLALLYFHDVSYSEVDESGLSTVKLLLSDQSVSDILQDKNYLSVLKDTSEQVLSRISILKNELEDQNIRLDEERFRLGLLKEQLLQEEAVLESQRQAKQRLLQESQNKEQIFQQLLVQTKIQEEQALDEINQLRTNLQYFEQAAERLKETLGAEEYERAMRIKESIFNSGQPIQRFVMWPVEVTQGFSALFEDDGYVNTFGVQHGALDIPTYQATPIRSVADGIVLHAKQSDSIGYNYIAIAHEGGVVTVYGHVFATLVEEGDFVEIGQIIGLSGGIPGTPGAGYRTTGAHVHIEVHVQGQRVDPMLYLPVEEIDADFIPKKYEDLYEQSVLLYGKKMEELIEQDEPVLITD